MTSHAQSQISRLTKEIANIRLADAKEAKKEAQTENRINSAFSAIQKSKSISSIQSKQREVERRLKDLARVKEKRGELGKKLADKSTQLSRYEAQRDKEVEKVQKKTAEKQKRLLREQEMYERRITSEIRQRRYTFLSSDYHGSIKNTDFFVCHASEDKDSFVRDLATQLRKRGATIWYDEFTLKIGDSLRREIDRGLLNSRFGIVVLSTHFFAKEWPQRELDGLFSLDSQGGVRILPVWHEITKDEVLRYSPMLSDRLALDTSLMTLDEIVNKLLELVERSSNTST